MKSFSFFWICVLLSFPAAASAQTAQTAEQVQAEPSASAAIPVSTVANPYTPPDPNAYMRFLQSPYPVDQPVQPALAMTDAPNPAEPAAFREIIGEGSKYRLGVDDVVTVMVRDQPDFSGRFVVDPEGNIQYNFVGDIPAVGRTKEELKAGIVARLQDYVRFPEVAVMVSEYRSKAVYVIGFVNRPGKYTMHGDEISVKEAVVAAGLPRQDAATGKIFIVRPSQFNADGKPQRRGVNLNRVLYHGHSAEDFLLQPGDTVIVGQKFFDKFINTFSRIISPVVETAGIYEIATNT